MDKSNAHSVIRRKVYRFKVQDLPFLLAGQISAPRPNDAGTPRLDGPMRTTGSYEPCNLHDLKEGDYFRLMDPRAVPNFNMGIEDGRTIYLATADGQEAPPEQGYGCIACVAAYRIGLDGKLYKYESVVTPALDAPPTEWEETMYYKFEQRKFDLLSEHG